MISATFPNLYNKIWPTKLIIGNESCAHKNRTETPGRQFSHAQYSSQVETEEKIKSSSKCLKKYFVWFSLDHIGIWCEKMKATRVSLISARSKDFVLYTRRYTPSFKKQLILKKKLGSRKRKLATKLKFLPEKHKWQMWGKRLNMNWIMDYSLLCSRISKVRCMSKILITWDFENHFLNLSGPKSEWSGFYNLYYMSIQLNS